MAGGENDEEKLERAMTILERDAFRCEGALGYDRILALAQKLELSAPDLVRLRQRLLQMEIRIEGDPITSTDEDEQEEAQEEERKALPSDPPDDPAFQNAFSMYLAEAGHIALLTPPQEIELMRRIRAGELAAARLVHEEADADGVLAGIARDGMKARHQFVEANLRLVVAMAKTTPRGQMPFEDLVQEGNFGLLKAVELFDHTRGLRFSTYASWWVWAKMQRAVSDRGTLVRVPAYLRHRLRKVRQKEAALTKERKGVPPTDTELAEHLGWTREAVQFLRDLDRPALSLDRNVDDDGRESLADTLPSNVEDAEETTGQRELLAEIVSAIESLKDREKLVMQLRFGLKDGREHTLEEVGAKLGVTRERVRQIQNIALERVRHPARSKAIAELIELLAPDENGEVGEGSAQREGEPDE
jgi:RNA polymerase sigma factor (sigma-70 family)